MQRNTNYEHQEGRRLKDCKTRIFQETQLHAPTWFSRRTKKKRSSSRKTMKKHRKQKNEGYPNLVYFPACQQLWFSSKNRRFCQSTERDLMKRSKRTRMRSLISKSNFYIACLRFVAWEKESYGCQTVGFGLMRVQWNRVDS